MASAAMPTFDVSSSLMRFDVQLNALFLKLKARFENDAKFGALDKLTIIAIDKSGSMSGSGIKQAKEAIIKLIEELHGHRMYNITVVSYESSADIHGFKDIPFNAIASEIERIHAGGGTNFDDAFSAIGGLVQDFVSTKPMSREVAVIFFTDGQGSPHTMPQFKRVLAQSGANTAVHTIGFTANHDARLLNEITLAGTVQGTFQYVRSSDEIPQAMSTVSKLVITDGMTLGAKLVVPNSNEMKLFLEDDVPAEDEQADETQRVYHYKCVVFLPQDVNTKGLQLVVSTGQDARSFELAPQQVTEVTSQLSVDTTLSFIQSHIMEMKEKIIDKNATRVALEVIRLQIDTCDTKLDESAKVAMRLPSMSRKRILGDILECKQLVAAAHSCLSSALARTLTNDKIATLNSLAYKNITKKGLQKKLDKRVEANVTLFEKLDERIGKEVAGLDFTNLERKYPELNTKISPCAISCLSWVEALKDSDCLCIALDIGRSQAAIADPTQVVIRSIRQTFITCESFMTAIEFALVNKNAESAHGGFVKFNSSEDVGPSIVVGQAREAITGALPLFLNEENWRVAKHKMKPILGWMTTLDVLGYSFAQVKAIPFLVLARAVRDLRDSPSEWTRTIFDLVLQTCINIYKDASVGGTGSDGAPLPSMAADIKSLFQRYIAGDMSVRTVDVIPNNDVFLAQLLVSMHAGDISFKDTAEIDNFFCWIAEEELRRKQPAKYRDLDEAGMKSLLFKVLNINVDRYVTAHVEAYNQEQIRKQQAANKSKADSFYVNRITQLLTKRGVVISDLVNPEATAAETTCDSDQQAENKGAQKLAEPQDEIDGTFPHESLSEEARQIIGDNTFVLANFVAPTLKLKSVFHEDIKAPTFASIGLESTECQLAAVVQNMQHSKNADRRDAITNNTCIDVRDRGQACAFLKNLYVKFALEMRMQQIREIDSRIAAEAANLVATTFGMTENLLEAAGTLLGCFQGTTIRYFYGQLQQKQCPLVLEKMEMLFSGQFHGVPLIADHIRTKTNPEDPVQWRPSKKNMFRMWYTNRKTQPEETWRKLARSLGQKYEIWMDKWYHVFEGTELRTTDQQ